MAKYSTCKIFLLNSRNLDFFQVAHSYVIRNLDEYRELIQKHDQLVLKLEHAQVKRSSLA